MTEIEEVMVCDFWEYATNDIAASMLASWIAHSRRNNVSHHKNTSEPCAEAHTSKTEAANQQPAPTCQLCESMWKQILKLQVNLQVTVALDDILTVIS